jgi:hypothetical protein
VPESVEIEIEEYETEKISEKKIAASRLNRLTGCNVISVACSEFKTSSKKEEVLFRIALYSGK